MPYFPIPPEQRAIRQQADRGIEAIRVLFLEAVARARGNLNLAYLEQIVASAATSGGIIDLAALRIPVRIDTLVGSLTADLAPLLEQVVFRGTQVGAPIFAETMGFRLPPDLAVFRQGAQGAARSIVGELVRGIEHGWTDPISGVHRPGSLETIQRIIAEGYELGHTPARIASNISQVVGLTDRQSDELLRFWAKLEADDTLTQRERLALLERERKRKLGIRGRAIGRTETTRAASAAQDLIWQQAVDDGELDAEVYEQEWLPAPGNCPICEGLRGKRAPIGGEFPAPGGKGPPNPHPHCRCGRRLRRKRR